MAAVILAFDRRISSTDRRSISRGGDRRQHGERAAYKRGCRCTPCKAAEARYRAELRREAARGRQPLGRVVSIGMLHRQLDALRGEGFTDGELARRLGLKTPKLQYHTERVTVASRLKVQRLYRAVMADDVAGAGECRPTASAVAV